jgi:hypothetical protein
MNHQNEGSKTMSATLDELFVQQTGEKTCEVSPYTEALDRIVASCPEANIVLESQQWSRMAAIQQGECTIYEPGEQGDTLPFDPTEVAVQITYFWNGEAFDLAWVATWPFDS